MKPLTASFGYWASCRLESSRKTEMRSSARLDMGVRKHCDGSGSPSNAKGVLICSLQFASMHDDIIARDYPTAMPGHRIISAWFAGLERALGRPTAKA